MAGLIPRSWNDRVLWLLERSLGLPAGSDGTDIPLGAPGSAVLHRVRLEITGAGPATELVIQMPDADQHWQITSFSFVFGSGAAANMQPRIGEAAGFSAGGVDERIAYDAQAVGTAIRDVFCSAIPVRTDGAGRLYLRPGFDAGSNNEATAELWLQQAFVSDGST